MPTNSGRSSLPWLLGAGIVVGIFLLLFGFGSTKASGGLVPSPWDKVVHFSVFATLAIGLRMMMPKQSLLLIAVLGLFIGAADEFHQMLVPGRQPDLDDWLADLAGTLAGLALWYRFLRNLTTGKQCQP